MNRERSEQVFRGCWWWGGDSRGKDPSQCDEVYFHRMLRLKSTDTCVLLFIGNQQFEGQFDNHCHILDRKKKINMITLYSLNFGHTSFSCVIPNALAKSGRKQKKTNAICSSAHRPS